MVHSNVHTLLTVFVRVAAIAMLLKSVLAFGVAFATLANQPHESLGFGLATFSVPVLTIVAFGLVWLFADVLVRLALARPDGAMFESDLDAGAWQRIGFSVVGVWFAAAGLVDLVYSLGGWLHLRALRESYPDMQAGPEMLPDAVGAAAQFVVGVALLLGARGLQGLLARMRGGGQRASAAP